MTRWLSQVLTVDSTATRSECLAPPAGGGLLAGLEGDGDGLKVGALLRKALLAVHREAGEALVVALLLRALRAEVVAARPLPAAVGGKREEPARQQIKTTP